MCALGPQSYVPAAIHIARLPPAALGHFSAMRPHNPRHFIPLSAVSNIPCDSRSSNVRQVPTSDEISDSCGQSCPLIETVWAVSIPPCQRPPPPPPPPPAPAAGSAPSSA